MITTTQLSLYFWVSEPKLWRMQTLQVSTAEEDNIKGMPEAQESLMMPDQSTQIQVGLYKSPSACGSIGK